MLAMFRVSDIPLWGVLGKGEGVGVRIVSIGEGLEGEEVGIGEGGG